ncbi:MAG: hypothetical protein ACYDAP_12980 [Thermoplasmataceae archaeon]
MTEKIIKKGKKSLIVIVSVVVVGLMLGLSVTGMIANQMAKVNNNIDANHTGPSIQALSQQLNSTLSGMFPNIKILTLTNSMFNGGNEPKLEKTLESQLNLTSPFSIIFFNNILTRKAAYDTYLSAMKVDKHNLSAGLMYPVNGNKSVMVPDKFIFTTPTIVITNSPDGMYFINEGVSSNGGIIWALRSYQKDRGNSLINQGILSGDSIQPMTLTSNGFSFLNTYGWYYNEVNSSVGQEVLSFNYKVDLYGVTSSTSSGTYYFVMAYTSSSAKGYSVSEPWYDYFFGGAPYYYENFKPSTFESTVNWETSNYAGQELFSWGPQNSGSDAVVTYSVGASLSQSGLSVSAGISYGIQGGVYYSWNDQSSPAKGIAKTENTVGSGAASGTLYTVHPTSVGELNPTKSGGYPPFLFYAHFSVNTQSSGVPVYPQEYSISSPDIYMYAY